MLLFFGKHEHVIPNIQYMYIIWQLIDITGAFEYTIRTIMYFLVLVKIFLGNFYKFLNFVYSVDNYRHKWHYCYSLIAFIIILHMLTGHIYCTFYYLPISMEIISFDITLGYITFVYISIYLYILIIYLFISVVIVEVWTTLRSILGLRTMRNKMSQNKLWWHQVFILIRKYKNNNII